MGDQHSRALHLSFSLDIWTPVSSRKRPNIRLGSVRKFGVFWAVRFGSVLFGSVGNFGRTTEFFGQKMPRNRAFSCKTFTKITFPSSSLLHSCACTLVITLDPKFRISQYHVTPTPMRITCTQCPCKSRDGPRIQVYVLMRGEKREKETS
eukprot:sb/3473562/